MRRVVSLWLCHWPTDRQHRGCAEPAEVPPLVTIVTVAGRRVLAAVDAAAAGEGLVPGMSLADARARVPELVARDADPAGDAQALEQLADWCGRFTPWTATDGADGIWLDITGCVPLFESEAALAGDLLSRLRARGIACRAAVAETAGAAWALARYGVFGEAGLQIVPDGGARAALASLPVAGLRLPAEVARDLRRLGLRRIGDLYGVARAPLTPRFGLAVARRLDQALGLLDEPISPRRPPDPAIERLAFAEPILTAEDLRRATRELLDRLCRRLDRHGLGSRRLELACYRVDGRVERAGIGTSRPSREPAHLMRLFADRLERIAPGLGIEVMVLGAAVTDFRPPAQDRLDARAPELAASLVDRLANRLGAGNVVRLVALDSHVPERAVRTVPAMDGVEAVPWTLSAIVNRPRPIRLLARPDPVEVMAPVPDDPPVMFRWRRTAHRVRHAEGPERIAPEWWIDRLGGTDIADEAALRDYYRVEDESGRRFWLYRQGLYRADLSPKWFLHGFFP